MKHDHIIPCVCLTCGIRNDFSGEGGLCKNGHDNWLEYRDVILDEWAEEETRQRAMKLFGMTLRQLKKAFIDTSITQFKIVSNESKD